MTVSHIVHKTKNAKHWTPRQLIEFLLVELQKDDCHFKLANKAVVVLGYERDDIIDYYTFFAGVGKQEALGILSQAVVLEALRR